MTTAASPTPSSRFKLITSTLLDAGRVDDAPLDAALDVDASSSANLPARPLSRADYFRRLRAFRDCVRWNFDKPSALQGPACAARGWTPSAGQTRARSRPWCVERSPPSDGARREGLLRWQSCLS